MLTKGGPSNETNLIVYSIYREAFVNYQFGSASAQAVVLFIIILIMTLCSLSWEKGRFIINDDVNFLENHILYITYYISISIISPCYICPFHELYE